MIVLLNLCDRLKYCAIFKVRKFGSLFYKFNTCFQKTTTCIGLQVEQLFSVNVSWIFFFNFGRGFCGSFSMFFQKLQLFAIKKILNNFYCIVLLFVWAQKLCPRFFKLYFRLEILIILSFVVSFLADICSNKKLLFWRKNIGC